MKPDPLPNWLGDPELEQALASLRDSTTSRALPADIQGEVQSLLGTHISSLGGTGGLEHAVRAFDTRHPVSSVTRAKAPLQWLTSGPGKAWLFGGLIAGGAALFVPTLFFPKLGKAPSHSEIAAAASQSTSMGNDVQPSPRVPPLGIAPTEAESSTKSPGMTPPTLAIYDSTRASPATVGPALDSPLGKTERTSSLSPKRHRDPGARGADQDNLDLNYETSLLRLARASLLERPDFARELLKNYDRRFPSGSLRHEYEILLRRLEPSPPSQAPSPDLPSAPKKSFTQTL